MRTSMILIPGAEVKHLQRLLDSNTFIPGYDRDGIIATFTGTFGAGWEVDIKVCNGDRPYIDAILFFNGNEVQTLDVSDRLLGWYKFTVPAGVFQAKVCKG